MSYRVRSCGHEYFLVPANDSGDDAMGEGEQVVFFVNLASASTVAFGGGGV